MKSKSSQKELMNETNENANPNSNIDTRLSRFSKH